MRLDELINALRYHGEECSGRVYDEAADALERYQWLAGRVERMGPDRDGPGYMRVHFSWELDDRYPQGACSLDAAIDRARLRESHVAPKPQPKFNTL